MKISKNGIAIIIQFEGFSAEAYFCPAGKKTIGYGHVILSGETFDNDKISLGEAHELLAKDIEWVEEAIHESVNVELTQNQYDALCSFIYNVGANAFEKSTLLRLLNSSDYNSAAGQFNRWIYSNGRKLAGLASRRQAESALFSSTMQI